MRIGPALRFKYTFDGDYTEVALPEVAKDPLKFRDDKPYTSRIAAARKKTGREDAMAIGVGSIKNIETTVLVQDFSFMGGSLGMGAGEGFLKACETAVERRTPLIVFTAAGGARMQEGALSLMQMPRTTLGVEMLKDAKLPYIVVLTDPTTGGVTASYAMLGDVHLAEPGALIGFAVRASSSRPSAKSCPKASSARNTFWTRAWWTRSCTATSCARCWAI